LDWIGSGFSGNFMDWMGLDWIHELMDWIGLGQQKWTHVQLWCAMPWEIYFLWRLWAFTSFLLTVTNDKCRRDVGDNRRKSSNH